MRYLTTPSTAAVRDLMLAGRIGHLTQPGENRAPLPCDWAADNGCFGRYRGDAYFLGWLTARIPHIERALFAVAPDVVGNADATAERSAPWLPRIRELGYPAAYVGQDGATPSTLPWGELDYLFIGGTTDWKLSADAAALIDEAHRRDIPTHFGRVNSERRFRHALKLGCASADGTFMRHGADANMHRLLAWLRAADQAVLS